MYELSDQTWKLQPKFMSEETLDAFLCSLEDYIISNSINEFEIILHGGEPLLYDKSELVEFIEKTYRLSNKLGVDIIISLQTNAILIDQEWIDIFNKYSIYVGVSHDGPSEINDKNRVYRNGKGTEEEVTKQVKNLIGKIPHLSTGVLTVIDPTTDPIKIIDFFYKLGIKKIDFLLPDQNYSSTNLEYPKANIEDSLYTTFLINAFIHWRKIDDPDFEIRIFRELVLAALGKPPSLDSLGVSDVSLFVIETDGGLEPLDTFKCCGEDFTKIELNIKYDSLHKLRDHNLMNALVEKSTTLSQDCIKCKYLSMCGGGYMPHRYNGIDFNSPSVYCKTLYSLCEIITKDIYKELKEAHEISQTI